MKIILYKLVIVKEIHGHQGIEDVQNFIYLGSIISNNESIEAVVNCSFGKAQQYSNEFANWSL